jgi:hypothetical protein
VIEPIILFQMCRPLFTAEEVEKIPAKWITLGLPCQSKAIMSGVASTPSEEYMNEYVLGLSPNIGLSLDDPIRWQNTLMFMCSWGIVFCERILNLRSIL